MRIVCIQQSGQQLIQVVSIHWATVGEAEPLKPLFYLVGVGLQLGVQCPGIGVYTHVIVVENDQYIEVGFEKIVERFVWKSGSESAIAHNGHEGVWFAQDFLGGGHAHGGGDGGAWVARAEDVGRVFIAFGEPGDAFEIANVV